MSLKILQELAGVEPDGAFGPNTFRAGAAYLELTNHSHAVHFFAQVAHETGMFKRFSENLNYSAKGLRRIFGKYFPDDGIAEEFAHQPQRIANRVYANRMGNGGPETGDGWNFRGRGALQLTGRNNYTDFSQVLNDPEVLTDPSIVAEKYSFTSAVFFFDKNNLWGICEEGFSEDTIRRLTKRINGGYNGIAHRIELTEKYRGYRL